MYATTFATQSPCRPAYRIFHSSVSGELRPLAACSLLGEASACHAAASSNRTASIICHARTTKRARGNADDGDDGSNDGDDFYLTQSGSGVGRRDFIMRSVVLGAALGAEALDNDGRTVFNSVLGAYGLPKLPGSADFKSFEDVDEGWYFEAPKSWVKRRNTLRSGVYIADFNTADKLSLETFQLPAFASNAGDEGNVRDVLQQPAFVAAAVSALLYPGAEVGGDSRLELPPSNKIKSEMQDVDGMPYLLLAFPSETITRSGYQVRRKNVAIAAIRRNMAYCLGASARSDQWDPQKEALFQRIIDSFRLID
jgi:hypothetical protein